MIYFTENDIDRLIEDDAPLGDLTTFSMDIGNKAGAVTMKARQEMTISGTEEVKRVFEKTGITEVQIKPSSTKLNAGDTLLTAEGKAGNLHLAWRSGLAMLEFASGIATRTQQLVENAKAVNPGITIAGTRKHPPYLKKVALKALMAGGGIPHRTGLSDTILIFSEHLLFSDGIENIAETVSQIKNLQKEKKIVVEAHSISEALCIAKAGADVIQVDKMPPDILKKCVWQCLDIDPNITMIAAGGINAQNVELYAQTGVQVLVTSWMYFAQPADIKVEFNLL